MVEATQGTPRSTTKRLLRILLCGLTLATAWVAIDLVVSGDAATASETIDILPDVPAVILPDGSNPVTDILGSVTAPIEPIAAPLVHAAVPVVEVVVTPVEQAATVILTPAIAVIEPVIAPIVAPIITPLIPVVGGVFEGVTGALPAVPQLSLSANQGVLLAGGGLILGVVIAASTAPRLPAPNNGGNRDVPAPEAAGGGSAAAANLAAFFVPGPGSALHGTARTDGMPPSPTYGFDTTPD